MNRQLIKERIEEIKALSWDSEAAHSKEDKLHIAFITHIAEIGMRPYSDWAKFILALSDDESFQRWCG